MQPRNKGNKSAFFFLTTLLVILATGVEGCLPLAKRDDATQTLTSGVSASALAICEGFQAFQEQYTALVPSSCTSCHGGGAGGFTLLSGSSDSVVAANYLAIRSRLQAQDGSEISSLSESYFYGKISGALSHQGGQGSQDMQAAVASWLPADLSQTCVIDEAAGTVSSGSQ